MNKNDFEIMSVDELWDLHQTVGLILNHKLMAEKARLDERLQQLGSEQIRPKTVVAERRPYPKVFPKYRNPDRPSETWAGRGKQPRWLTLQLKSGKRLQDFEIRNSSYVRRTSAQGSRSRKASSS